MAARAHALAKLYLDRRKPVAGEVRNFGALEVKTRRRPARAAMRIEPRLDGPTSAAASQVMGGRHQALHGDFTGDGKARVGHRNHRPIAAVLWVSSSSEDMDLFLTLATSLPTQDV